MVSFGRGGASELRCYIIFLLALDHFDGERALGRRRILDGDIAQAVEVASFLVLKFELEIHVERVRRVPV